MIKKMLFTLMLSGVLTTQTFASVTNGIDFTYKNPKNKEQDELMVILKQLLSEKTPEQQKQFAFYTKQNLSTGYVMPSIDLDKSVAFDFVYMSLFNQDAKKIYGNNSENKKIMQNVFKDDPHFQKMFSQPLNTNPDTVSLVGNNKPLVINLFDDGHENYDFRAKRQVEKVAPQIEEYAKDYAAKVFTHVATRGENGPPVYMTPQQRKDFIRSAYMAGAMKLDNESVAKLDAKKLPLNVEDVASIRNGICIYLKYRGMLKDVSSCDVNKPITTQDYVKDGATKLAVEWASGGKNAILADTRMKGVYFPKTKQIDTKKLMYELKKSFQK